MAPLDTATLDGIAFLCRQVEQSPNGCYISDGRNSAIAGNNTIISTNIR